MAGKAAKSVRNCKSFYTFIFLCSETIFKIVDSFFSVLFNETWSRRPGFIPRSIHTKDLKIRYLIPPCLTLSIIRYVSRVKGSNPEKGVAPSPTHRCSSYWKESLRVALDESRNFILLMYMRVYVCVCVCVCVLWVQWKKKVYTLKWISPQENLFFGYLYFSTAYFWRFTSFSGINGLFYHFNIYEDTK